MRKNQARNDEEKIGLVSAAAASSVVPDNETTTYETVSTAVSLFVGY